MTCNTFNLNDTDNDGCFAVDVGKHYSREFTESVDSVNTVFTGYTFAMDIKDIKGGTTLLTLGITTDRTATGLYITPSANEVIELIIDATDTAGFADGSYVYEIRVTDPLPTTQIFMEGSIRFKEAVI